MDIEILLIIAAAIHVAMRLLKMGTLGRRIPARWRPFIAVALGGVAAGMDAYTRDTLWQQAVAQGLLAAATAMGAHDVAIEGILGGNEVLGKKKESAVGGNPR